MLVQHLEYNQYTEEKRGKGNSNVCIPMTKHTLRTIIITVQGEYKEVRTSERTAVDTSCPIWLLDLEALHICGFLWVFENTAYYKTL